jgi:hypothetical protein
MQQKRRAENNTAEPSPRHDRFLSQAFDARSVAQMNIATSSTSSILHGSHLDFHAPTFSYFVDRSPIAFPYVLDYLRNGAGPTRSALAHITDAELHALHIDADFFQLGVLSSLVSSEQSRRHSTKFLSQEDLFWREVCETIDQLYPMQDAIALPTSPTTDGLTPVAGSSTAAQAGASPMKGTATNEYSPLEKISVGNGISGSSSSGSMTQRSAHSHSHPAARSIGNMLRRLAFSKDPMLRVCHGTYAGKPDYEERLLEILHTTCTLCRRQIFLKPIGLREGRDTGCPVHPASAQWDRKARMWSCCGSPEFANSGCQFTGIHYTTWVFWNSDDRD